MPSTAVASSSRQTQDNHASPSVGYVAREFINRITPLAACADELGRMELSADARPLVEIIALATARAARTVRSLAGLGSCRLVSRTPCNPNELATSATREFTPLCRELGIALEVVPAPNCQPVMLDVSRFVDGLAHVLDVASDACSLLDRDAGPALRLRVENRPDSLAIVVAGNGTPIPEEAVREAFDSPLASGAPSGGTSLALFLARSALAVSGGELRMSVEGGWTRFEISLARSPGAGRQQMGLVGSPGLRLITGSGALPVGEARPGGRRANGAPGIGWQRIARAA